MAKTDPPVDARVPLHLAAPPEAFFVVSAIFHYLGPSLAVLLFQYVDVLGVAWMRIVSAALIFGLWRHPHRRIDWRNRQLTRALVTWGLVLGVMNCVFYLAISRLPLGTVAAIEFLPVVLLAAIGSRTGRNKVALALAVLGVYLLTDVVIAGEPLGVVFAFVNAALFALYIVVGHAVAQQGAAGGIDSLAAAMAVAAVVVTPFAGPVAIPAFSSLAALAAGIGIGVSSSVIPYVFDQLAMARLARSSYALLVSILPATAVIMGVIVLRQLPQPIEVVGVSLVVLGVGIHRGAAEP